MKQVLQLVSVFCLCCSFLQAQSPERSSTKNQGSPSSTDDAKRTFIQNQEYLSTTPGIKNYLSAGDDSLIGFDEKQLQAVLLSRGVYGAEYQNFLALQKRAYIKAKYKLSPPVVITPPPLPPTTGKPIGGGASINLAPCVNEDFEQTAVGQHTS